VLGYVQFSVAPVSQNGEMNMNEIPPLAPRGPEVYESFLVPHLFTPWACDLVARAEPKPGGRVLDVACGTGIVVRAVLPVVGPNGRVTGVDFSPAMLAVARTKVPDEAPSSGTRRAPRRSRSPAPRSTWSFASRDCSSSPTSRARSGSSAACSPRGAESH
jgi:SAM-dependent methyltransferase